MSKPLSTLRRWLDAGSNPITASFAAAGCAFVLAYFIEGLLSQSDRAVPAMRPVNRRWLGSFRWYRDAPLHAQKTELRTALAARTPSWRAHPRTGTIRYNSS